MKWRAGWGIEPPLNLLAPASPTITFERVPSELSPPRWGALGRSFGRLLLCQAAQKRKASELHRIPKHTPVSNRVLELPQAYLPTCFHGTGRLPGSYPNPAPSDPVEPYP